MIDNVKIEQIVNRIAENVKPEKIILFGSYARGDFSPDSDLDLCVIVKDKTQERHRIAREIRSYLWGIANIPKDIIVYTESEIDEWGKVNESFISSVMTTGRVLYENQK